MRLLLKFTEDNCEKVDRLVEMKEQYESKDETIKTELEEMSKTLEQDELEEYQEDAYIRRLNAGLFTLQRVCLLIASLSEESKQIRDKAVMLLGRSGKDMLGVFKIIEEEDSLMLDFIQLRRIARNEVEGEKEEQQTKTEAMEE
jgi:beta-catenin-like protein 1